MTDNLPDPEWLRQGSYSYEDLAPAWNALSWVHLEAIASNPFIDVRTQYRLCTMNSYVVAALLGNPSVDPQIQLCAWGWPSMRHPTLAQNPSVHPRIVQMILETGELSSWLALAANPGASSQTLTELAQREDPGIARALLDNPSLPPEAHAFMADSLDLYYLASLLCREDLTREAQLHVLNHRGTEAGVALAREAPILDPEVFLLLARHRSGEVRRTLAQRVENWDPDLPAKFVAEFAPQEFARMTEGTGTETLDSLLINWDRSVTELLEVAELTKR